MGFDELQQILGIGKVALKQHIVSMTLKKFQILVKEPKCKQVSSSDVFTVNNRFKSKTFKVRVPLVTLKNKRKAAVPAAVQEDRRILLEAAIVRIMKARASLDHNTLVAEVTRQLSSRFNPSPGAIKKRIESLLDRDYLERSSEDRKTYLYVA